MILSLVAVLVGMTQAAFTSAIAAEPAQVDRFTTPDGESLFAVHLKPAAEVAPAETAKVVVLFDTSASQTGEYRQKALDALAAVRAQLRPGDQLELMAVDVDPVSLTTAAAAPDSPAIDEAFEKLHQRAPLGTTDIKRGLESAATKILADDDAMPRAIVYIGDGVSAANLLSDDDLRELVDDLVERRVAVSSYAIGPDSDNHLLAALANATGGVLAVDNEKMTPEAVGGFMAQAVREHVLWPTSATWPESIKKVYPRTVPPLRRDRDSIVIGAGELAPNSTLEVEIETPAGIEQVSYSAADSPSDPDNAYLSALVAWAETHDGVGLPTVGSEGLRAARHVVESTAQNLNDLGRQAIATGRADQAESLVSQAEKLLPDNDQSHVVRQVLARQPSDAPEAGAAAPRPRPAESEPLIRDVDRQIAVRTEALEKEVQVQINRARSLMSTDPAGMIGDLKLLLERVRGATDIRADVRNQLESQIAAVLRETQQRADQLVQETIRNEQIQAAAEERRRINHDLYLREVKLDNLIKRMNALMDEGRYRDAEEVATLAQEIDPDNPAMMAAVTNTRMIYPAVEALYLRHLRQVGFVDALLAVEYAHVPQADDPPVVYPDPETWRLLTERRKEFSEVDLSSPSPAEKKIRDALDAEDTTSLDFIETPLREVIEFLADLHQIPIFIKEVTLDEEGISSDDPVTINVQNLTLRAALRLLLDERQLTYMIEDEVLKITTLLDAQDRPVRKVYPVADLAVPIINQGIGGGGIGGGIGGGGGGFGGGGGGFGGGGFGGGGGGFGGGGGGFGGGGGGFFNIPGMQLPTPPAGGFRPFQVKDHTPATTKATPTAERKPVRSAKAANASQSESVSPSPMLKPIELSIPEGADPDAAWNEYFATNEPATAVVRQTARHLTRKARFAELSAMIRGALINGQAQPWMYEALALSMQAEDRPAAEIERALLSGLDLSRNPVDLMYLATYMARTGFDARALQLFRQAAKIAPARHEPYMHGLTIAKRLNDLEGIMWATTGILSRAWTEDKAEVWHSAQRTAQATLEQLRASGQAEEAERFAAAIDEAMARDCVAIITWTGDADVDLLVEEPPGTICAASTKHTASGGVLLGDAFPRLNRKSDEPHREIYVCPRGFDGTYRLLVRRVWGRPVSGHVTVDVFTHYQTDQGQRVQQQIPLTDKDALITFDLQGGRRQEPLDEAELNVAVADQVAVSHHVLAQQIAGMTDNAALRDFAIARQQANDDGGFPFFPIGAVGFQPDIVTLPEGAQLFTNAVISADRRYVRVSPTPSFSAITEVNTFNFATGESGTSQGGTGGQGFGGGGGGGAGF